MQKRNVRNKNGNQPVCTLVYVPIDQLPFKYTMEWHQGLTVSEVVQASNIQILYPESSTLQLGIFAHPVDSDTQVKPGDRIEVYRPLIWDPKENRKQRIRNK